MLSIQEANELVNKIYNANWVQWNHFGTAPAQTSLEKSANVALGEFSLHCPECLNLNQCCFIKEKCPSIPLHPKCHCEILEIPYIEPNALCDIKKFSDYIFDPLIKNGKKQLFELWGYDILDSEYLKAEFERQARLAYLIGDYELGKLDDYGQRIKIKIKLKRKDKNGYVTFYSGWMTYPNGKIILTTPYGDK